MNSGYERVHLDITLKRIEKTVRRIIFGVSLAAVLTAVYDWGFDQSLAVQEKIGWLYVMAIIGGGLSVIFRYAGKKHDFRGKAWLFDGMLLLFITAFLLNLFGLIYLAFLDNQLWKYFFVCTVFIREFSDLNLSFKGQYFNPAQLFITSFLIIILGGTLLLVLPNATHAGISFLDALFTSTSAVCVTGLIVVDTGSYFTKFGQSIIVLLIQAGGIGIMTFTSYFSYFFRGGSSYEHQLLLKDMTNSEKIAEVFDTLKKIILLTLAIEAIGAFFIFLSLQKSLIPSFSDRLFFSIFHSVSAFCNAGFSTLPNSLYEEGFRFNYSMHLVIIILFITGGLGFPIAFNFFKYLKHLFVNRLWNGRGIHVPWVITMTTRLVLITTGILLVAGTFFFYWFEKNNTLAEHQGLGKVVTAFFGAATPRTAGFNSVDTSALHLYTLLLVFLLMWIGASPSSTGGGIKTTTLAIGTLNFFSIARGKDRLEVFRREVSNISVRRAFAVIALSLVFIGMSVLLLTVFDANKGLLAIAFECFSAYSTVGLSLGITSLLSSEGKAVLVVTMFIGRVGALTIMVAFLRQMKPLKYRYPTEDILIT